MKPLGLTRIAAASALLSMFASILAGCGTQGKAPETAPTMDLPAGWSDNSVEGRQACDGTDYSARD